MLVGDLCNINIDRLFYFHNFFSRITDGTSCTKRTYAKSASTEIDHEMLAAEVFYDSSCVNVEGAKNIVGCCFIGGSCESSVQQELHQTDEKMREKHLFGA